MRNWRHRVSKEKSVNGFKIDALRKYINNEPINSSEIAINDVWG